MRAIHPAALVDMHGVDTHIVLFTQSREMLA
jgi:hypothetical protein